MMPPKTIVTIFTIILLLNKDPNSININASIPAVIMSNIREALTSTCPPLT